MLAIFKSLSAFGKTGFWSHVSGAPKGYLDRGLTVIYLANFALTHDSNTKELIINKLNDCIKDLNSMISFGHEFSYTKPELNNKKKFFEK